MQDNYFLGVQSDGEITMSADNCQATEIPAVECGKRVQPEKGQGYLVVVGVRELEKDIDDACDGCDHKKEDTRGEKRFLLQSYALFPVEIENEAYRKKEQGCN